jgi:AcrR family transcriptional regulator
VVDTPLPCDLGRRGCRVLANEQKSTLSREDWLRAGLEALSEGGPETLKAARLGRTPGVTTGSFYWHFARLAEFRSELIEFWKEEVLVRRIREARAKASEPMQVLTELRKLVLNSGLHRYDAAMRSWASIDPGVQDSVREADEIRETFIFETFRDVSRRRNERGGCADASRPGLCRMAWFGESDRSRLSNVVDQAGYSRLVEQGPHLGIVLYQIDFLEEDSVGSFTLRVLPPSPTQRARCATSPPLSTQTTKAIPDRPPIQRPLPVSRSCFP